MKHLNSSYGHRQVLLSYVGVRDRPVYAFLQHGWSLRADAGHGPLANSSRFPSVPRVYWSDRQRNEAIALGVPNAVSAGAPFLYLVDSIGIGRTQSTALRGSGRVLMYPPHSTEFEDQVEVAVGIDDARRAIKDGHEVTVCLHPLDAMKAQGVAAYQEIGCNVVSHGFGRYDPFFLPRQVATILNHDEVWSYGVGTAALYASFLGRSVRFPLQGEQGFSLTPGAAAFGSRTDVFRRLQELGSLRAFAREELGYPHLRSRDELSQLLGVNGGRRVRSQVLHSLGRVRAHLRHLLGDETAVG